jgi:nitrite reductase/ring-hydroxylating ferredoxin subunit/multimeric flavodoxin WrbA
VADGIIEKENNNNFQYICNSDQISPGQSAAFTIKDERGRSKIEVAIFNLDGTFYAISNVCIHKGGPLSKGTLKDGIVACPWHGWKYSVKDGRSAHKGGDSVSSYPIKVSEGRVYVSPIPKAVGKRTSKPYEAYQELDRAVKQHVRNTESSQVLPVDSDGAKVRVLGISTTNMNDKVTPRNSTSESALEFALQYSKDKYNAETVMLKLRQLNFRHCEGYYSKDAKACIFPCSISEMDEKDQMLEIYDRVIIWADVVIVATPIRWGSASSLYYQMVQRMNCVQNQIITHNNYLIRDKVGAFIITGGQDNVQHVAGELLSFWSQLGLVFGKFPFTGWSRGWYAEDTENNASDNAKSLAFKQDIMRTVSGAIEMSRLIKKSRYDEKVLKGSKRSSLLPI